MGIGDDIIATGFARGAKAKGELIAFGDGRRIIWGPYSEMIFKNNPNIARRGQENLPNIRWIEYYKGKRQYNRQGAGYWIWNYDFRVKQGELFFDTEELCGDYNSDLILLEPNVPNKPCGPNKQWPVDRWKAVAEELTGAGFDVRQFEYGRPNKVALPLKTVSFRKAAAWLKVARLAILPEGGLHHAAAAVACPAVVIHGGFTPPAVLGYPFHTNLASSTLACGTFNPCLHCKTAMEEITIETVLNAVSEKLDKDAAA